MSQLFFQPDSSHLLLLNCNYITLVLNSALCASKLASNTFQKYFNFDVSPASSSCLKSRKLQSSFSFFLLFLQQFDSIFSVFLRIFWVGFWLDSFFFVFSEESLMHLLCG